MTGVDNLYDVFISYASEDKDDFVAPLARLLQQYGLSIWYDEFALAIGDSLRESIDRGLNEANYGVIILSPHFFSKRWPRRELDGLLAREASDRKVILPVWHNISRDEVINHSPMLAGLVAARSSDGLDRVIAQILEVVNPQLAHTKLNAFHRLAEVVAKINYHLEHFQYDVSSRHRNRLAESKVVQTQKALSVCAEALRHIANAGNPNDVLAALKDAEQFMPGNLMICMRCRKYVAPSQAITIPWQSGWVLKGSCPTCGYDMLKVTGKPNPI